jgi:hypothetical protein
MLKLYHYWSSVCSQKARTCLAEKGLEWQSHHVDLFKFENYEPWYTKLNPKAVVPTLDHDRHILIESNVILEYLDDTFPDVPLRPADPYARAQMRLWVYNSEELAHWNVNTCSHNLRHAKRLAQKGISHEEMLKAADQCPNPMIDCGCAGGSKSGSRKPRRTRPTRSSTICSTRWSESSAMAPGSPARPIRSPTSPWRR